MELVLQEKFPVFSRKTVTEKNLQPGDILRGRLRLRLRRKPVDEIPPPFLRDMINFFLSSVVRRLRLISDAALLRELLQFRINLAASSDHTRSFPSDSKVQELHILKFSSKFTLSFV